MKTHRFHLLYSFVTLKKLLLLCLLPLLRAALSWSLPALYAALQQDLALLFALAALSLLLWRRAWWRLDGTLFCWDSGVWFHQASVLSLDHIACAELARPLPLRPLGAARLTLYFSDRPGHVTLYLGRATAAALLDRLLPPDAPLTDHSPHGVDRAVLLLSTCNLIGTLAVVITAESQLDNILGENWARTAAFSNLAPVERFVSHWLPAGLAWMLVLLAGLMGLMLLRAALRVARFRLSATPTLLEVRFGLLSPTLRRLRLCDVTHCTVEARPLGRLSNRYPVYLSAGGYSGSDLPLFLTYPGRTQALERILPGFALAPIRRQPIQGRSPVPFFLAPGLGAGLFGVLTAVSVWKLPSVTPALLLGLGYFVSLLPFQLGAFLEDGAWRNDKGFLELRFTRRFTRYVCSVFSPATACTLTQNPFTVQTGRADLVVQLPCGVRLRSPNIPRDAFLQDWALRRRWIHMPRKEV